MINDIDGLINRVSNELVRFTDIAVVGLSGGADSTLVAILCTLALGKENVYGIHMPYDNVDYDKFNSKSIRLSMHLGIPSSWINIKKPVDALIDSMETMIGPLSVLNKGNIRSRMRMATLYSISGSRAEKTGKRVRVVGTGNLSEDFIGYDTKGGDSLCDIFPIGTLVKSEVYQLLDHFRDQGIILEDMIDRVPSAGLWEGQTDEGELGYSYNEMAPYVLAMFSGGAVDFDNPISNFVYRRWKANKHKHEAPPTIHLREFCK